MERRALAPLQSGARPRGGARPPHTRARDRTARVSMQILSAILAMIELSRNDRSRPPGEKNMTETSWPDAVFP